VTMICLELALLRRIARFAKGCLLPDGLGRVRPLGGYSHCMRTFGLLACSAVLVLAMTSCVGPTYDGVLWRQIASYKDPLTSDIGARTPAEFAESLQQNEALVATQFWNGTSDPQRFGLAAGGIVVWDVRTRSSSVIFSVMIASGPRDADADPLADPDTIYWGPNSVYTCGVFEVAAPSVEYGDNLSIEKRDCPPELVGTLDDGAVFANISDFYG